MKKIQFYYQQQFLLPPGTRYLGTVPQVLGTNTVLHKEVCSRCVTRYSTVRGPCRATEVLHDRIITFKASSYERRPGSLYNQSNHGKAYFSNPPQFPLEGLLQDNAGRRDRHLYCSDFGKGSGPASRCAVSADGSSCDCWIFLFLCPLLCQS